jgi:hypothetical protein
LICPGQGLKLFLFWHRGMESRRNSTFFCNETIFHQNEPYNFMQHILLRTGSKKSTFYSSYRYMFAGLISVSQNLSAFVLDGILFT